MSIYNLPPFNPNKGNLERRLKEEKKNRSTSPQSQPTSPQPQHPDSKSPNVGLLPGVREDAERIAQKTGADPTMVLQVLGKGLMSGGRIEEVQAMAMTSRFHEAMQYGFDWDKVTALLKITKGDAEFFKRLVDAGISPEEAKMLNPVDEDTGKALDVLGLLN